AAAQSRAFCPWISASQRYGLESAAALALRACGLVSMASGIAASNASRMAVTAPTGMDCLLRMGSLLKPPRSLPRDYERVPDALDRQRQICSRVALLPAPGLCA